MADQDPGYNSERGPSKDHSSKVWLKLAQWFQRRRLKCELWTDGRTDDERRTDGRTTDGRTTDAKWWQKLTWPFRPGELKIGCNNSERSHWEESNEKIPWKSDEKWKFYVVPKITFLAPLAPFISKTVRDRKNMLAYYWKLSLRGIKWKNPIKIGWKIKIWCGLKNRIFTLFYADNADADIAIT